MSEAFIGELRPTAFATAPRGWAICSGQLLPINSNQALYALLGTMYGGDGRTTFALPDLRGRVPLGAGGSFVQGTVLGEESHALTVGELPAHDHAAQASASTASLVGGAVPAAGKTLGQAITATQPAQTVQLYSTNPPDSTMAPAALASAGGGQPHENRQPLAVINWIICLQGIFPTRP